MKSAPRPRPMAPPRRLRLGDRAVLVPVGWHPNSERELVRVSTPVSGGLLAKAPVVADHTSIAWTSRVATGDVEAEAQRVARALVEAVPGARSFAPESFHFADGALGRRVTVRVALQPDRPTVQVHVLRIEGRTVHHLIATMVGRDQAKLALELDGILSSFGGAPLSAQARG